MSNTTNPSNKLRNDFSLKTITTYQSGVVQSTAQRVLKQHTDALLKEFGLTTMHWFIVGTVFDTKDKGITVTELATKLGTGVPFLTNTVNLLESKGILYRDKDANDVRLKRIKVSEEFSKECPKIESALREKMRNSLYKQISPQDLATYIKVLYQLTQISEDV